MGSFSKKNEDEKEQKTELIQFRCTPSIKEKLTKLAEKEGIDVSKFVRNLSLKSISLSEKKKSQVTAAVTGTVTAEHRNEIDMESVTNWIFGLVILLVFVLVFRWVARFLY